MSLIVGRYYRGIPKQKPKQWGSISQVSSTVLDRAASKGPVPLVAIPFWEYAGNKIYNYALLNNKLSFADGTPTVTWGPDHIDCTDTQRRFICTDNLSKIPTGIGTFIVNAKRVSVSNTNQVLCWLREVGTDSRVGISLYGDDISVSLGTWVSSSNIYSLALNQNVSLCLRWSSSSFRLFADGNSVATGLDSQFEQPTEWSYVGILDIDGTTSYSTKSAHVYSWLYFGESLSNDLIAFYADNPYYLFQPPVFRTYFDLSEITETTLSFSSINSNSVLNNDLLSAIRLLNPNNLNCFTEISVAIISGLVNIIQGNDLSDDSLITQASVQAIRKLTGQEISSLSQITNVILSTAKQFNLNDLESLTEVTNVVFSVINKINGNNLLSDSQIINLAIDIIRKININSLESISDITNVVLSITGGLRGIDVESQSEITSLALAILRVLKENNIESNSSVNEATLNVIHQLDINNINSLSDITDLVAVAGSNIGITDNNSLTQITQAVLDIIKAVSPININIESETSSPVISVLRTLFSNTINIVSNITSVGITNISTAATGKVTITFSMAVPSVSWSLE